MMVQPMLAWRSTENRRILELKSFLRLTWVYQLQNVGISKEKYNLIAFLDLDDEWHPKT